MRWKLLLSCTGFACNAWAREPPITPVQTEIEEVVVTGEQPGPQLWKLTRHGHVLWIFGTVAPKPRDITWRSREVAEVLANTQQIFDQQLQATPWAANVVIDLDSFNPLAGMRAKRREDAAKKQIAPFPPLRTVLSPALYARYAALRDRYLHNDTTIENQRPIVAAGRLYNATLNAAGLTMRALIHDEVHKLAKKRRVKIDDITRTYDFDIDTFVTVNLEFSNVAPAAEIPCMEETLTILETQLPTLIARANAWATGNIEALRKLPQLQRDSCVTAQWSAPRWAGLRSALSAYWLDTVDRAVAEYPSTLVLLDMSELFEPDGLLAQLAQRGYTVEER
jgi:hypothetical protein